MSGWRLPGAVRALLGGSLLALAACGGDANALQSLGDLSGDIPASPGSPVCLWNQAYQENFAVDSVAAIEADAQGCYVLVDPFESAEAADAIPALKAAGNTVGCYISVGTCEEGRADYEPMRAHCTTVEWEEWPGEFFVDDPNGIAPFMEARIAALAEFGCDMVEFDNMDFANESEAYALGVSDAAAADYVGGLCDAVHAAGMQCMAKNQVNAGGGFDGGTFESYGNELDWWDHDDLARIVDAGGLAVIFHYNDRRCDDVTRFYRLRYGSGVSVLCEDPDLRGYRH